MLPETVAPRVGEVGLPVSERLERLQGFLVLGITPEVSPKRLAGQKANGSKTRKESTRLEMSRGGKGRCHEECGDLSRGVCPTYQ